ncbi:hypothetical protein GCM10009125_00430 [Castellaniella daejeonensis]|uniref:HTH cro/C1-type domain-containing protein n=2 Tax=Castellaniella daejeonensis TaxID=659013 RepID=A0ABP3CUX1_9BURK
MPLAYHPIKQTPAHSEGWLVVALRMSFETDVPLPHFGRGRSIHSIIADRESDPKRAAALARARRKLASSMMENSTAKHTLASLRLASGHSQASLAAAMGTQQSYIARLERNGGDMQSSTIRRMADALGVTCDQIIDAIEDNETE